MKTVEQLKKEFEEGKLGTKKVPRWDEYGNGWWLGDKRVMHDVPSDWPFHSSGFPGDWEAYANKKERW